MNYIIRDGELYHYGVKGMKWGVRRYRNSDGTLTPAGKRRVFKDLKKSAKKPEHRLGGAVGKVSSITSAADRMYDSVITKDKAANQISRVSRAHEEKDRRDYEAYRKKNGGNISSAEMQKISKANRVRFDNDYRTAEQEYKKASAEYKKAIDKVIDEYLGSYGDRSIKNYNGNVTSARDFLEIQIKWGNMIRTDK